MGLQRERSISGPVSGFWVLPEWWKPIFNTATQASDTSVQAFTTANVTSTK